MKVKYFDLENKRVFITGGGSGIGASIVESFCEQGSDVFFVDINKKESQKLLSNLKKKNKKVPTFIECDLLNIKKLQKIIKKIISKNGNIDILINNAANDDRHTTNQVDEKYWNNRMDVNLKHFPSTYYQDYSFFPSFFIFNLNNFYFVNLLVNIF